MHSSNMFSPLESLHSTESDLASLHTVKKGAPRDATLVASKPQQNQDRKYDARRPRNPLPRKNIPPGPVEEARGRKPNSNQQYNRPRFEHPNLPPRLRRQQTESSQACSPPPVCCTPNYPLPSPCPGNEDPSAQLKRILFSMQRPLSDAVCPGGPTPVSQPPCSTTPNMPVSVPAQSNPCTTERHNKTSSSTPPQHVGDRKEAPRTPEVVSCASVDASILLEPHAKLSVSLPTPPGLPKPSGRRWRGNHRGGGLAGPTRSEYCLDPIAEDSNFQRHNGPAAISRVISPPPSDPTPNPVRLPPSKNIQQVPRSPTVSNSSSEDSSGSSFARFGSDTTFTSVDSNVSSKDLSHRRIPREICRNWSRGYPCFSTPCLYLHERQNHIIDRAPHPTPLSKAPPHSPVTKSTFSTRNEKNEPPFRKPDPPSRDAEPPLKPEPLYATTISDHMKVRFDQGFEVREVITGFESRWVHVGNIDCTVTSSALRELLAPYNAETINLPESSGKPVVAKVQFASSEDAIKAVTELNGVEFTQRTISAKLSINNSSRGNTVFVDTDVQLVWPCPSRAGYAGYDTLKKARVAIDSLHGFPMEGLVVSAQLYEGLPCVGAYNVIFKHLPANVTDQKLRKVANSMAVMLGRPNYQSLDSAIKSIRSRLEEYGTVTSFDILPAPHRDGLVKAWARFTSPAEARAAQDDFDRRRPGAIGLSFISCRHVLSVSHTLSAASYRKMREDIGWLRWSWQRRYGFSVSIREKVKENTDDDGPAYIKLSSELPELLSTLKYEFEQLLQGETITLDKKPLWDDFLVTQAGYIYISQVQAQYPGVLIQVQNKRRAISLWGPIVMRHRARQDIVRKVAELQAQQFWKIPLSGKLWRVFCSAELSTLQELLGPENCVPSCAERALVVRGNDLAFRTACNAVEEAQNRQGNEGSSSDVICPVCFGDPVVPVPLACGHQWCRACLMGYLTSAVENKMFPLRCLGNDASCSQCIPLGLARKLLPTADFSAVIEAAFWVYVHSRPDQFHHCPTPDCTQVYRAAPPNAVLQCPSCLVRICPSCCIEYHDGMTCEERDVAEDKLFNEWTSNHDVKSCPGCRAPIERSEGCNHMTCTRCQTHSCWECLATFPRGQGIYEHMRIKHGSIGL